MRTRLTVPKQTQQEDEDVQADFTVRNLVDAARIILRGEEHSPGGGDAAQAGEHEVESTRVLDAPPEGAQAAAAPVPAVAPTAPTLSPVLPTVSARRADAPFTPDHDIETMSELEIHRQSLRALRKLVDPRAGQFSLGKFFAGILFAAALWAFLAGLWLTATGHPFEQPCLWMLSSLCLSGLAIALYVMNRE